jgi:CBS domain-containing protein
MKVSDLIGSRREVFSMTEDTSTHQAAQYMREKRVRSVGVVDSAGQLSGVISQAIFRTRWLRRTSVRSG